MESRKGRWKALQLILAWFYISGCSTVLGRNIERYDTAYECEGKTLRIECREGELIHLIRANYGRFSITICNEHGNTDWSVNCMSPTTFRVLYSKCNQQQNCSIVASTTQFGDPCPNTLKYLEAHYQCVSASTTTTSRPSPTWLLTSVRSTGPSGTQATTASSISGNGRSPSRITTPARAQPAQSASSASSTVAPSASSAPSRPSSTRPWTEDESIEDEEDEDEEEVVAPPPDDAIRPLEPATQEPTQQLPFTSSTLPPWKTNRRTPTGNVYNGNSGQHRHGPFCNASSGEVRKLRWHETRVNDTAEQSCPEGTTGMAYWRCLPSRDDDEQGVWERGKPDLKDCRSVWLTSLARRVQEGEHILGVSSDLSQVTNNSSNLYGGDMLITTQIIRNMTDKMAKDISTYQDPRQKVVTVEELLQGAIATSSNLLDQSDSWDDLNHTDQRIVASALLQGLEENAFLLADTLTYEKRTNYSHINNILMEVWVLDVRSLENEVVVFPSEQGREDKKWAGLSVELASSLLGKVSSQDGFVRLVFMAFDRLEKILEPQSSNDFPGQQLSINEQREPAESSASSSSAAAAQQFEQMQKQRANTTSILNSKVISASLSGGRHIKLPEGEFVKLHLKHLQCDNYTNPRCVFWNFTTNDWSEEGCIKLQSNSTHTVCQCNHLTNFAILMDWNGLSSSQSGIDKIALHIITYIGCIISVVCLFLAIVTFQLFRGLKSDRTTIHKNLCICLFIAELVFICGIEQTKSRTLCGIVAGLLHFFFLCAFAWMFLEGFQLYVMLIEVFEAEKSRLRWYYLVAYGAPLLVVGISCLIDSSGYGTTGYCWLGADNYFIFSFVGPVILVILANLVFLSMAIYMMCRHANTTVSMKSKEHSRLASASGKEENALPNKLQAHLAWLRGAIVLVFLLGLTWTFGLLYLNKKSVIMAYIFTVLNSLQGLFIFVFHCVQNEKVRKEYRKFIRRHSWLPKCLRCSKGSSGGGSGGSGAGGTGANGSHGNSHGGAGAGKDFASHNTSSNPSAPTTDSSGLSPHANSNYLVSTGQRGGWGTLQREHHAVPGTVLDAASDSSPCPTPQSAGGGHAVSTLPYARHHHHHLQYQQQHHQQLQQQLNHHHHQQQHHASTSLYPQAPNIPKSATATWGPLNKNLTWKNISFKSQSRDSGHGGSEQEDSPRVLGGQPAYGHSAMTLQGYSLRARERRLLGELEVGSRATTGRRAASPYNHTYTEIRDARHQQHYAQQHGYGLSQHMQDDPVYEEIERAQGVLGIGLGCPEVAQAASDMSDEDGRRQSDMSRQSSRSYGDHRPLIPYSPAAERGLEAAWALEKLRRQHQASSRPELDQQQLRPQVQLQQLQQQQQQQQQQDHTRTVAVLDGHTVVCHLQPQAELYAARGLAPPSYSEC